MYRIFILLAVFFSTSLLAQTGWVKGTVESEDTPVPYATIGTENGSQGTVADEEGAFLLKLPAGNYVLLTSALGHASATDQIIVRAG